MTIKEVRAMFAVGSRWHAMREDHLPGGKHADENRTVKRASTKDIVFELEGGKLFFTAWPKSTEIIEARDGHLSFQYGTRGPKVTLERIAVEA